MYVFYILGMSNNISLIKDKKLFYSYAKEHTIPEIAVYFSLDEKYVKNYVGNHKVPHKNLEMWHGMSSHRLYKIYCGMVARCYNENHIYYKDYGGRGIVVCEEWLKDRKLFFKWALENNYADNLQIDRIDCNGNYEPSNCRFVSNLVNQNNRRVTLKVKGIGLGIIVSDKDCNPLNLPEYLVWKRYTGDGGRLRKWSLEEALATQRPLKRGSHITPPIDENILFIVKQGLSKIFSKYETT